MRRRLQLYSSALIVFSLSGLATGVWTPINWQPHSTYCPTQAASSNTLKYYASPISWMPTTTTSTNGYTVDVYDVKISTQAYAYEATRLRTHDNQYQCDFCPYDFDDAKSNAWSATDVAQADPTSSLLDTTYYTETRKQMYGPCLSGQASTPATCVQHPAFFPPEILGEYFFPKQDSTYASDKLILTRHELLLEEAPFGKKLKSDGNWQYPTFYGLGKAAVETILGSFSINWAKNYTTDPIATAIARMPFQGDNWTMWAQLFCTPGCHRDAALTLRGFASAADYNNNTRYNYLSRFFPSNASSVLDNQAVTSCRPCPPWTAVVAPYDSEAVLSVDPRMASMATECIPWFGGLPQIQDNQGQTTVLSTPGSLPSYVGFPSTVNSYPVTPCPVNTYNRKCAYDKLRDYQDNVQNEIPAAQALTCTPCPPGWSTNGSTGAWFCLPPPGQIFAPPVIDALKAVPVTNYQQRNTTTLVNGLQWRNRNLWAYELECGFTEYHCKQCSQTPGDLTNMVRPSEFNEIMIFSTFFRSYSCPSNFYCPDAVTKYACNASTYPYSPPGSSNEGNCTCARGTYRNPATDTCTPCTTAAACAADQYLPTKSCKFKDAATQDAPCLPCSNINNATMIPVSGTLDIGLTATSIENPTTGAGGMCSFRCITGYVLSGNSEPFACVPKVFYKDNDNSQNRLWNPAIQYNFDWLIYTATSTPTPYRYLTNLPITSKLWANDTLACPPSAANVPSYMGPYLGYNYTQCIACPRPAPPANGGSFTGSALDSSVCTQVRCRNNTQYINYTSWACESCTTLQQKVCSSGTYLYGQGCLDDQTLFNQTDWSRNCRACGESPTAPGHEGQYLSLDVAHPNTFCTWLQCPQPANASMWPDPPCGGSNPGHWTACTDILHACPPQYYVYGANPTCGTSGNWPCVPCVTQAPVGHYIAQACDTPSRTDARVLPCIRDHYCTGGTALPQACPDRAMQTIGTGATGRSDCFCRLGYMSSPENPDVCIPFSGCENTTAMDTPGPGVVSPYYMELALDPGRLYVTKCFPCTNTTSALAPGAVAAYARGTTFHASSCVCNANYYGVQHPNSLVCTACTSTSQPWQCTDSTMSLKVASCAASGSYVTPSSAIVPPDQACQYAAPPFGTLTQAGQSNAFACPSSYTKADTSVASYLQGATGSSLYVANSLPSWIPLYKQVPHALCTSDAALDDTSVSNLAVSQVPVKQSETTADVYVPYAFWTPKFVANSNYPRKVYATCFTTDSTYTSMCPPVMCVNTNLGLTGNTVPPWTWSISNTNDRTSIVALSVSEWFTNLTASVQPAAYMYVAAMVRDDATIRLKVTSPLYLQQTSSTHLITLQSPASDSSSANMRVLGSSGVYTEDMTSVTIVDMIYAPSYTTYTSSAAPTPVWIVAFNKNVTTTSHKCGVAIFGVLTRTQYANVDLCSAHVYVDSNGQQPTRTAIRSISTVSLYTKVNLVTLLVVFEDIPNVVYQTTLLQGANPSTTPQLTDMVVYATTATSAQTLSSIRATYPFTENPSLLGLVSGTTCDVATPGGSSANANCLFVADVTQQTFIGIQNAPFGSNPTLIASPPSVLVSSTLLVSSYYSNSVIVAAHANRIYALAVSRCQTLGEYWNGRQCTPQQCKRRPQCTSVQTWINSKCTCNAGYYIDPNAGTCQKCIAGMYCLNEASYQCPGTQATQASMATSPEQCLCPTTGQYADSPSTCASLCPVAQYCPNSWNSYACPGVYDTGRMVARLAVTPASCVCKAGYYGASCSACPNGYVCSEGVVRSNNQAYVYRIVPSSPSYSKIGLIRSVQQALTEYYAVAAESVAGSEQIIATASIEIQTTTHNTDLSNKDILVVMLQGLPSAASAQQIPGWTSAIASRLYTNVTLNGENMYETALVPVNQPVACAEFQQPNPARTVCLCVPGAGSNTGDGKCVLCPVNFYSVSVASKQLYTCQQCPLGTWTNSLVGQTNCSVIPPGASVGTTSTQNINNIAIIAGTVGGLVVLIIIIVIVYFVQKGKKTNEMDQQLQLQQQLLFGTAINPTKKV